MLKRSSVDVAKDRLKTLIVSDRVCCKPDEYSKINHELFRVLSKYIELTPEEFDVVYTRSYIHINLTGEKH
ncbi:MAG: cell division topological specificity factor MinE [Eubacterium sp.]|nr:cell division topological specificity factor MinE [Eubacterium sp.]